MLAFEIFAVNSAYLLPEYLSSAVNALINSLKISHQTEGDFL